MAHLVACVEAGNRNVKCGLFGSQKLQKVITARAEGTIDLTALLPPDIQKVILCRTNPRTTVEYGNLPVVEVTSSLRLPVVNRYLPPESLGIDRLVSVTAAWVELGGSVAVVSAGTCITLTAITGQGEILGGYISPGIATRLSSMHIAAPALPDLQGTHSTWHWNGQWIASSTTEGMLTGAVAGAASELLTALRWCYQHHGIRICILCGGDAPLLYPYLRDAGELPEIRLREWFILEALYTVAKHAGIL